MRYALVTIEVLSRSAVVVAVAPMAQLARGTPFRAASDGTRLASVRLSTVLDLEAPTAHGRAPCRSRKLDFAAHTTKSLTDRLIPRRIALQCGRVLLVADSPTSERTTIDWPCSHPFGRVARRRAGLRNAEAW